MRRGLERLQVAAGVVACAAIAVRAMVDDDGHRAIATAAALTALAAAYVLAGVRIGRARAWLRLRRARAARASRGPRCDCRSGTLRDRA